MKIKQYKNFQYNKNKFISITRWKDTFGNFFILPSICFERNIDLSFYIKATTITLLLFKYRIRFSICSNKNLPIDDVKWRFSHYEKFIKWMEKEYKKNITIKDLEKIIQEKPYLKGIINNNTLSNHYLKLFIAREILNKPNNSYKAKEQELLDQLGENILKD